MFNIKGVPNDRPKKNKYKTKQTYSIYKTNSLSPVTYI